MNSFMQNRVAKHSDKHKKGISSPWQNYLTFVAIYSVDEHSPNLSQLPAFNWRNVPAITSLLQDVNTKSMEYQQ